MSTLVRVPPESTATNTPGLIDVQLQAVNIHWLNVCNEAGLSEAERNALWGRQFLNPFALQEYSIA